MQTLDELYSLFPPNGKDTWTAQLEKDLKGTPLTSLIWEIEPGLPLAPLYTTEDRPTLRDPLLPNRKRGPWQTAELIEVDDPSAANVLALEAVRGGADALGLPLRHKPDAHSLQQLLEGLNPIHISLNFGEYYEDKDPHGFLRLFTAHLQQQGLEPHLVQGSIDFDPLLDWVEPPIDALAEAIRFCSTHLPLFKCLQINGRYYFASPGNTSTELAMILAKGAEYLARLQDAGIPATTAQRFIQCSVAIGSSYFLEIAKLRALRLLWAQILQGFGVQTPEPLELVVHFAPETQDENHYTNMIRATTQALSAVIGGADRLYILPADAYTGAPPSDFHRRIARNVQHLLRLESFLDKTTDPAAGSYYVETLTDQLALKAWDKFVELDSGRVFG
jgi:methylmalonyl-CoA mutase